MKEREVGQTILDQAIKIIDCIEGKADVKDTLVFPGSNLVDTSELKKRLSKEEIKQEIPVVEEKKQEPKKTRAMTSKAIRNKKL
jgi:hypothetical protein